MTVLIILRSEAGISEAVRFWKQRISAEDHAFLINLRGMKVEQIEGRDTLCLVGDPAKSFSFGNKMARFIGRRLSFVYPVWNLILLDTWHEFIWQVRAFDPDIIDLRWVADSRTIQRKLSNPKWRIVCTDEDLSKAEPSSIRHRNDSTPKVSIVLPIY